MATTQGGSILESCKTVKMIKRTTLQYDNTQHEDYHQEVSMELRYRDIQFT